MDDLEVGDFLYQSDQELFLVVASVEDDHYEFAVHGWRKIDKERVTDYIEDDHSKIYDGEEIGKLIREKGGDAAVESFEGLRELFDVYEDVDVVEEGPQSDFSLDERS